ncbi:unnamed protein product [Linum trigynum]|uniref:TIR domain-containing protein n=1 Tax=Linum trigynum TaxID=586398 RepID=A0AAV2D3A5_9ROSI
MTSTRGTIDERLTALLASTNQAQSELDDRITNVHGLMTTQAAQFQELRTRSDGHSQQFVTLTTRLDSMEANSATRFAELETSSATRLADLEARLDDRFGQFTHEIRNMLQALVPRPAGVVAVVTSTKYDVFISFRGIDVRNSFLGHLYSHLKIYKRLAVYKDDVDLERGEQISPSLLQAIERSDVYVVLISPNYADSPWCLEELEKILESRKLYGRRVIPVFYGVDPSAVGSQKLPSTAGKIQRWEAALSEIAGLSGFDSKVISPETKLIDEISKAVFQAIRGSSQMVKFSSYSASRGLVGVDRRLKQVQRLLCSDDHKGNWTIGLWGMAGSGKTALAKAFFDLFSSQFEASYFFCNFADAIASGVTRQPFGNLQNEFFSRLLGDHGVGGTLSYDLTLRRLSRMKALVVIDDVGDDVGDIGPLKDLLNGQYSDLFGSGSIVVMTSRNQQLLKSVCHTVYEVEGLGDEETWQLFCLHAFREKSVRTEYLQMIWRAIRYVGGNPLATTILGAHLYGRDLKFWDRELHALQNNSPNSVVQNVLRRSYDGLSRAEKDIFLDLACFYDYWHTQNLEIIEEMFSEGGRMNLITNLVDKSLIRIIPLGERSIKMNPLLRDLGCSIVNEERQIGNRSRLWKLEDVSYLFQQNKGTQSLEGIFCKHFYQKPHGICTQSDAFEKMENLRFLVIDGDASNLILPDEGLKCLPNPLRILKWRSFSSKYLASQFSAENLLTLDLWDSKIEQLWEDDELDVDLGNLQFLSLLGSKNLRKLPNLSTAKRLKVINLSVCTSLVELPTSILDLPELEYLYVSGCSSLKWDNLEGYANSSHINSDVLPSLKSFALSHKVPSFIMRLQILKLECHKCTTLTEFPAIPSLKELTLTGSLIEELVGLEKLTEMKGLRLSGNEQLVILSSGDLSKLKSLEEIRLDGCSKLSRLPESIGKLIHLGSLDISRTAVRELPSSIGDLTQLYKLLLKGCKSLVCLPDTMHKLSRLDSLVLVGCDQLRHIPGLPSSLKILDAHGCRSLQTLSIGSVEKYAFTSLKWCFAQCWSLDPGLCSKLVDKFARDSVRIFGHSSLILPAKWGCGEGSITGSNYDSFNNTRATARLRGQPWELKSTIFCALLSSPDPALNNQGYEFRVIVKMNNTDKAGDTEMVSDCPWRPFQRYEDREEEEEEESPSNDHFLVWSIRGPLVEGKTVDDGSEVEFIFRDSYKTKGGSRTLNLIKNCRVIPVYSNRVVRTENVNEDENDDDDDDDESPNELHGLYDQLCSSGN